MFLGEGTHWCTILTRDRPEELTKHLKSLRPVLTVDFWIGKRIFPRLNDAPKNLKGAMLATVMSSGTKERRHMILFWQKAAASFNNICPMTGTRNP
jgi:hypothetical protein